MKIANSNIMLGAEHHKKHEVLEEESLHKWNSPEDAPQNIRQSLDRLDLSKEYYELDEVSELPPKLQKILRALEVLTGKKIDLASFKEINPNENAQKSLGWGIDYTYEKTDIKEENLSFSAKGNITTENGEKIDFSFAYKMHSKVQLHEKISFKAGDALIDPLVINFDNNTISMSDVKHTFDLNLDGKSDTFSFVGNGSGFLALDRNKDGKINDGSELFGPTLGNGFEELKAYDEDNNHWIDENDTLYDDLLIWTKDEDGMENLFSLKEKNIGGIYTKTLKTEFDLGDAKLKESSIYISEDGEAGSVSEIDLVV